LLIADFLKGRADAPLSCVDDNPSPQRLMGSILNILVFAFLASEDTSLFETSFILSIGGHLYRNQDEFSRATILGDGTVALVIDPVKLIQRHTQMAERKKMNAA
jgi:hypothetical protein